MSFIVRVVKTQLFDNSDVGSDGDPSSGHSAFDTNTPEDEKVDITKEKYNWIMNWLTSIHRGSGHSSHGSKVAVPPPPRAAVPTPSALILIVISNSKEKTI